MRAVALTVMLMATTAIASADAWQGTRGGEPSRYRSADLGPRADSEFVMRELDLHPGDVVVDIGAGKGWWEWQLSEAVGEEGIVYAAEIEQDLVDDLGEELSRFPQVRPILVETDGTGLEPDTCDLALFIRVYHHLDADGRVDYLRHLHDVVKSTGRIAILDYHHDVPPLNPEHAMPPADLFRDADSAGWIPVRYEHRPGGKYYIAIFAQKEMFEEGPIPWSGREGFKLLPAGEKAIDATLALENGSRMDIPFHAAAVEEGQVVADVGCGRGRFSFRLAEAVGPDGLVHCRDTNDSKIAEVQGMVAERGMTNLDVEVSQKGDVMLPESSIDVVLLSDVYQFVLRQDTHDDFMDSLERAVKPGGIVVVTYVTSHLLSKEEDWRNLLDQTVQGFTSRGYQPGRRFIIDDGQQERPALVFEFRKPGC